MSLLALNVRYFKLSTGGCEVDSGGVLCVCVWVCVGAGDWNLGPCACYKLVLYCSATPQPLPRGVCLVLVLGIEPHGALSLGYILSPF